MPVNFSLQKINYLVLALCKLHNYCIDASEFDIPGTEARDKYNIGMEGGFRLPRMDVAASFEYQHSIDRVNALLDGGDFVEEGEQPIRDQITRNYRRQGELPIYTMHKHIESNKFKRPKLTASGYNTSSRKRRREATL